MFCHRCGAQAGDAAYCPNCGQALPSGSTAAAAAPWTPPLGIEADSGRWLGEAWNVVMADLGPYALIALLFILLNGVPFIQGALIAGFHIHTIKKLKGQNAEIGDFFQGFNFFIPTLVASLLIGVFTFVGTL
ncbi:MAG: zinc ribbon domain-containing protein, partial [Bryobacterales bacterium]|nr:zinc ribbon domain-containing protein [Bryobacterales bacterium]